MGLEKNAGIWGAIGKGLWAGGKGLYGAGKSLIGGAARGVTRPIEGVLGRAGSHITSAVRDISPNASLALSRIGRGVPREMAYGGLLMGGLNAATADPGERAGAFARGFAGGALSGAAFRGVSNLARGGLYQGLGKQRYMQMRRAGRGRQGWQSLSGIGSKALMAAPFAAGLGASFMTPTFEKEQPKMPQVPWTRGGRY